MATFYADSNGKMLAFAKSFFENQDFFSVSPVGSTFTIDFDETTNAALVADIVSHSSLYSAPAGVLNKNSTPVVISASSNLYAILTAVLTGVPKATLETFIVALWNGTATSAQQQKAIAYIAVLLHLKFNLI